MDQGPEQKAFNLGFLFKIISFPELKGTACFSLTA